MQVVETTLCSIMGCAGISKARSMCSKHYARWRRSVNGPISKSTSKAQSQLYIEDVVLKWESDECLRWPFQVNKEKYASTYVKRKSKYAHKVICEIKNGPPPQVNSRAWHTCGNKEGGCVNPKHIKWVELGHSIRFGRKRRVRAGENHHNSKLSNVDVLNIYRNKNKIPASGLARNYGVSLSAIYMIWSRRNYKLVTEKLTISF